MELVNEDDENNLDEDVYSVEIDISNDNDDRANHEQFTIPRKRKSVGQSTNNQKGKTKGKKPKSSKNETSIKTALVSIKEMSTLMKETLLESQILSANVQQKSLPALQRIQENMKQLMEIRDNLKKFLKTLASKL